MYKRLLGLAICVGALAPYSERTARHEVAKIVFKSKPVFAARLGAVFAVAKDVCWCGLHLTATLVGLSERTARHKVVQIDTPFIQKISFSTKLTKAFFNKT
jgi:hypothetical protein